MTAGEKCDHDWRKQFWGGKRKMDRCALCGAVRGPLKRKPYPYSWLRYAYVPQRRRP